MNGLFKKIGLVSLVSTSLIVIGAESSWAAIVNNRPLGANDFNSSSLQTIMNGINSGINVKTDQSSVALWNVTKSKNSAATMIIELAGLARVNTFGLYDPTNKSLIQIFEGDDVGNATRKESATIAFTRVKNQYIVTITEVQKNKNDDKDGLVTTGTLNSNFFGFYLMNPQGIFYTEDSANQNGKPQTIVFDGNGNTLNLKGAEINDTTFDKGDDFILAFEDIPFDRSDKDFNDMVLKVGGIGAVTPEDTQTIPEPLTILGTFGAAGFGAFFKRKLAKK
ncbi:DUF4114 domain-containing protein [Aphanothece sacrum]|uniref:DUF4114 domain-containing protein n=1 Tax=Aphanothece sacrum FPU1 TaxID=1920663 RepID=A0A401IKH3_APHSA|nr:DUF4114 domain-containing protein [Aphanothece sacrum]GBF81621.1 hypothetical protein AsFPU1_3039 [Aphanothece sacrum FPU1]GBF84121.1 hypothetical protein AsFPU3_1167 [Aphanothece sacrum FPU3]